MNTAGRWNEKPFGMPPWTNGEFEMLVERLRTRANVSSDCFHGALPRHGSDDSPACAETPTCDFRACVISHSRVFSQRPLRRSAAMSGGLSETTGWRTYGDDGVSPTEIHVVDGRGCGHRSQIRRGPCDHARMRARERDRPSRLAGGRGQRPESASGGTPPSAQRPGSARPYFFIRYMRVWREIERKRAARETFPSHWCSAWRRISRSRSSSGTPADGSVTFTSPPSS